jgi:hypothetical protein
MNTRQLLTTLLLGALGWIALLGVFVFIDEPQPVGGPAPHFHLVYVAYLAVPFVLMAAAAFFPIRLIIRRRHERA